MEFTNTNKIVEISDGKSILELKVNELGSYLKFKKPLAINWGDCEGSIAEFYAIFSFSQDYRDTIKTHLKESLNYGNFQIENQIVEIRKLLTLFENGKYNLSFEPKYKYEISDSWNWDIAKNRKLFASNEIIRKEAQEYYSHDKVNLNYLTESFYPGYTEFFIFTQPSEIINNERVSFYENEIRKGKKPVAIIYSGYSETKGTYEDGAKWIRTYRSGKFIIDGHHKLLAYKSLNQTPSLLRIEKIYESDEKLNFTDEDFDNDFEDKLQKCQITHFKKNKKKTTHNKND